VNPHPRHGRLALSEAVRASSGQRLSSSVTRTLAPVPGPCSPAPSTTGHHGRNAATPANTRTRSRALSIRSNKSASASAGAHNASGRRGFSLSSLRGPARPELAKRLQRLIKSASGLVTAHEAAGRERLAVAAQLSEWGEQTGDEAVSDVSDKVGVVLAELGEQEDAYAHALDDARALLKAVRNTERSVQPSRDGRARVADDIAKLKSREPQSARLVILEQELVRAEAENLVAEAQLSNVVRCLSSPHTLPSPPTLFSRWWPLRA